MKIVIELFSDGVAVDITSPKGEVKELKWWNVDNKAPIESITKRINEEVNSWYKPTFELKK